MSNYQVLNGGAYAKASAEVFVVGGRVVTQADADGLDAWVAASENQFTPSEYQRVKQNVAYLQRKVSKRKGFAPRVTLTSVIYLAVAFLLLWGLWFWLEDHLDSHSVSTLLSTYRLPLAQVPILLVFACFATISVGWPRWLHVIALVLACVLFLWLLMIHISALGLLFLAFGWLIFMFIAGGRR